MNWRAIKNIYKWVLVQGHSIEYLGEDRYKIIGFHDTGEKFWEGEFKNEVLHGESIYWNRSGQAVIKDKWENGNLNNWIK